MNARTIETMPDDSIQQMLLMITGHSYSFAIASERCWDRIDNIEHDRGIGYFQMMPDGADDGFFDWYCNERPFNQFYRSKEDCVLSFLVYWAEQKRRQV